MRLAPTRPLALLLWVLGCATPSPPPASPGVAPSASPSPTVVPSFESSDLVAPPAPSASSAAAAPAESPPAPPSETKLTLLEAGKEPRQKLRFHFSTRPETMVMDLKTRVRARTKDQSAPEVSLPTLRTVIGLVPAKISAAGDLNFDGQVKRTELLGDSQLPAEARDELKQQLDQVAGLKIHGVVTSRCIVQELSVDLPPKSDPQVAQTVESIRESLRNLCTPFPEEAVGPGARWQVDSAAAAPLRIAQKTVFSLRSVTPKTAEIEAKLEQSAPRQKISTAGLPAGTSTELESLKGRGRSKVTSTFSQLVPVSSMSLDNDTVTNVEQGGNKMQVSTALHMEMSVRPGQ
jgi:hypothetical protein